MSNLGIGNIFGTFSGIITSLGLMIGMYSNDLQKRAYIVGLLSISLSDSFSDAFGIYNATDRSFVESINAFSGKFIFPVIMTIPFLMTSIKNALIINSIFSTYVIYYISKEMKYDNIQIIKNLTLTWSVVGIIYWMGLGINKINL